MTLATDRPSSTKEQTPKKYFKSNFTPGENDVIIARGKSCYQHKGNKIFRQIVASKLDEYSRAIKKSEKSKILSSIVSRVRKGFDNATVGNFVRYDPDAELWFDTGDFIAREKVSQTFRDFLHTDYRSSNEFKKKRRQHLNSKADVYSSQPTKRRRTERRKLEEEKSFRLDLDKRTELSLINPIMLDLEADIVELKEFYPLASSLPRSSSLAQWFEDDHFKLMEAINPMKEQIKSNWFAPTEPRDQEKSVCSLNHLDELNFFQEKNCEEICLLDEWKSLDPLPFPLNCGARTA